MSAVGQFVVNDVSGLIVMEGPTVVGILTEIAFQIRHPGDNRIRVQHLTRFHLLKMAAPRGFVSGVAGIDPALFVSIASE